MSDKKTNSPAEETPKTLPEVENLRAELEAKEAQIATLEQQVASQSKQMKTHATELKKRDDEIASQAKRLESLQNDLEAEKSKLAELQATAQEEAPIIFEAKWQDPAGADITRKVTLNIPKVRLPEGGVVHSRGLLKLATGQELSDQDIETSPLLAQMKQARAVAILNRWAQIGAGTLDEV